MSKTGYFLNEILKNRSLWWSKLEHVGFTMYGPTGRGKTRHRFKGPKKRSTNRGEIISLVAFIFLSRVETGLI